MEKMRIFAEKLLNKSIETTTITESFSVTVEDNKYLLNGLKAIFKESEADEQIRLLTISPPSWGWRKIESFFSCNSYQAKRSIKVRKSFGILPKSLDLRGAVALDEKLVEEVINFYQTDGISIQSSNKKDVIHVSEKPVPVRYMCMTVAEAYALFLEQLQNQKEHWSIGSSSFYDLRPKWVKIKFPHDVCTCIYHENF